MAIRKQPRPETKKRIRARKPKPELTIFENIAELGASIPSDEQARHPQDFARNYHHYVHGHPKQDLG